MFGEAELLVEGSGGFGGGGVGGFVEVIGDLEDSGDFGRQRRGEFREIGPVDGAGAGPEVLVALALIVMEVEFGDAGAQELEGVVDAGVAYVGVAYVEGDADVREVADVEDLEDVLGGGDVVLDVFDEDFDAEGVGEGLDVLDGGE